MTACTNASGTFAALGAERGEAVSSLIRVAVLTTMTLMMMTVIMMMMVMMMRTTRFLLPFRAG
jgi:hypothetical protein